MMIRIIFSAALVLSLWGCGSRTPKDRHTDTFTTGVVAVGVDESFAPILRQEADVFESIYTQAGIVPLCASETEVIDLLLKDSVRLAVTTRPLRDGERAYLNERKFFPQEIKLAKDAIALIVNKSNPDSLISVPQLRKVLTGEITRWDELSSGSRLGTFKVVFDHSGSSTVRYAVDSLCGGHALEGPDFYAQGENARVIDYVAHDPSALGIVGVSWIGNRSDSACLSFLDDVRVMGVSRSAAASPGDSFKPYQAYIAMGDYPLSRDVYVILNDPRSGLASGFCAFLTSDKGQRIILRSGLVPATQAVRIVNMRDKL